MITSFRYLSAWSFFLFSLWFVSDRLGLKINRYLPIQFLVTITWFGYLAIYMIYHKIYQNDFSNMISFLLNMLLHYIPYHVVTKKMPITTTSIQFFIVIVGIYLVYLSQIDKTPIDVYFNDKIRI